ncbi:cation diffusion facilitator CzcD-associated flavoprotein CzcO [Bradyrhizobium macuxiense]|uniref:Cation diffusion facilitator CzcD-associated flavoprotein CzcO n=1 Tax=Bradyrhizobium macuxiense TaxID=1755647 RepID=A0A560MJJ5_9BRAD|nr:NAD(P)-binding domain-containing protein [Bradyrhizobium macuxiense]TWC07546.1 cation diffusion facilitator CzcD-associated flavoprotein CzcO [Bradyrhizobium macuxiense]
MGRSSTSVDVAVIGAGPYGLSLAAHLRARGVEHRIFGEPMGPWKHNMPRGMLLKSYPWATCLSDPASEFTVKSFCSERALPYHDVLTPLTLERFIEYAEAFRMRYVPAVESKVLTALEAAGDGLRASFDDGETVNARRVVVAVGLHLFKHLPQDVAHFPAQLCSHSGDYGPLDPLDGKDVIVVGSGSSATDLAALLHERGISVSLVARAQQLRFANRPRNRSSIERVVAPLSGIGPGWGLSACAKYPRLVQLLPEQRRIQLANPKALGPLGGAFVKDRVVGKVPMWLGTSIQGIEIRNGKVQLNVVNAGRPALQTDHVIFATGYKADLSRLGFLDQTLLRRIRQVEGAPQLSSHYETSVPGLHFIGPAAANSFGPVCRFVYGTHHPARTLAQYLSSILVRARPALQVRPFDRTVLP